MDEPLSALDENLREEMRVEVSNLQEMLGSPVSSSPMISARR